MPGHTRDDQRPLPDFYLRPEVDGRPIDPDVDSAFKEIWPWFWNYVGRQLKDPDCASDLAEEIACRVTQHLKKHPGEVRSLVGLCRVASVNFITSTITKEGRIDYRGLSQDVEATLAPTAQDWYDELELSIWVDQILQGHDPIIQKMLQMRVVGKTWDEIGPDLGLTAGQARLRFGRALEGIRDDLRPKRRGGRP